MTAGSRAASLLRLFAIPAVAVIAIVVAWKSGYFELDSRRKLVETVQQLRLLPFVEAGFVAAYALAVTMVLPAAVLTVLGGAIFGPWIGALLAWGGSMIATALAHWLGHSIARQPLKRLFGEHRLLKQLRDLRGVVPLFRLRLIPVAPFAVLAYIAGLADVSLRRLLLATALGVIPSVAAYSYVGAKLLSGLVSEGEATKRGFWIAGGVTLAMVLLSVIPAIVRRARR